MHRHRNFSNFIVNLPAGLAAYAFHDTVPSVNVDFEMKQKLGAKQLARPKVTDVKPYAASARKQVERKVVNDKERKNTPRSRIRK